MTESVAEAESEDLQFHPSVATLVQPEPSRPTGPIPMSMPAILQNPRLKHLPIPPRSAGPTLSPIVRREKELSKRKARRAENARLAGNPHVVRPSPADYRLHVNPRLPTFRRPLPPALLKANQPPPDYGDVRSCEPAYDSASAAFGHFSMSLKDARRVLRQYSDTKETGPVERLVAKAEEELNVWLEATIFLNPSKNNARVLVDRNFDIDSEEDGDVGHQLVEIQRTANALVWSILDPYLRLAIHCLARVHGCPSFSKDGPCTLENQPSSRHTWILNPNPLARRKTRRRTTSVTSSTISGLNAEASRHQLSLETPPATDLESRASGDELASSVIEETETELLAAEEEQPIENVAAQRRVHRWASRLSTPLEERSEDGSEAGHVTVVRSIPRNQDDESDGSEWAADHEDAESLGLGESVASLSTHD